MSRVLSVWGACVLMAAGLAGQATGRIEGRLTYSGVAPAPVTLDEGGGSQPVLYVDRSGGLQYAVVFLPDAQPMEGPPRATARMNQRRFVFEPQVLAVRAGQTVRFTNDDPANHNVRAAESDPANTFSLDTASGAAGQKTRMIAATPSDRPIRLSCDIHPWMAAWIYVFDHDRFAVTAPDGRFRIEGVPPGRHRVSIRQPSGALAREVAVEVRAGEISRLDVRFTAADLGLPAR